MFQPADKEGRRGHSLLFRFPWMGPGGMAEQDSPFLRFSIHIVRKGGEILYSSLKASSLSERILTFTSGRWVRTSMTVSLVSLVELI